MQQPIFKFWVWEAPASWKCYCECFWHSDCEFFESVPAVLAKISWNFYLSAAAPLLETNNDVSPVCLYIVCPVLMACTWKYRVLLAAFRDKISIFHLGPKQSTARRAVMVHAALSITLLLACSSFIWCSATWWRRETKLNPLNNWDFPLMGKTPVTRFRCYMSVTRYLEDILNRTCYISWALKTKFIAMLYNTGKLYTFH